MKNKIGRSGRTDGFGVAGAVVLGLLTAFGPFLTDFYLPVLPRMAEFFRTSASLASMSLTAAMAGLAAGQLLIGPVSDRCGRKGVLLATLALFVVSTLVCVVSADIIQFNVCRFFQGIGGAGGIVIAKSMATDLYTGLRLSRFMALLAAINGVTPVVAPLAGGAMAGVASWQGIFALLVGLGVALFLASLPLPETLSAQSRIVGGIWQSFANLFRVFRNPVFSLATLGMVACGCALFSYIAASPFVLQSLYGLSEFGFSLCFAGTALMLGGASALAAVFKKIGTALKTGTAVLIAGAAATAFSLMGEMPVWCVVASYVLMMVGFGLLQPPLTAVAMDSERRNAGSAGAVCGASMYVAGGLVSPLVGIGSVRVAQSIVALSSAVLCLFAICLLLRALYSSTSEVRAPGR